MANTSAENVISGKDVLDAVAPVGLAYMQDLANDPQMPKARARQNSRCLI